MSNTQDRKSNLNQLERVREIHRLIRRFTDNPENESLRVTDESLAQALHVSSRQARRDRDVLIRLIDEKDLERGHGGEECALQFDKKSLSWRYMREIDLSVWVGRLDDEELGSLLVAQQALAVFSGMPLAKHIGHIFEEDAGGLVGNSRSALQEDITKLISFYPDGAGKIDQDHFATIFRGLLLSQQLEVSYQSKVSAAPKVRVLRPYHLCCFKHQWRLIAHDSRYDAIRDFVVTPRRLKSVKLLSRTFKRPADFNAHEHLSRHKDDLTQLITLRIAPAGAHHVQERNWYGLISTKELKGGTIEAVFKVADLDEFKRFVLAFGSDCEVLAPAAFREKIYEEARAVLTQTNTPAGGNMV
jgi:predicted DNA-binding transcriptional regulator YafY